MKATCKQQKRVEKKTIDCTLLADVTTYFVNEHTSDMELQIECSKGSS